MKKNVIQYTIAEPCHENWGAMTPTEKGRFCNSCAKPVVDFTSMTDFQVLDFMKQASGAVCGRMTNHQLNRDFVRYEYEQTRSFNLRALVLGTALATFSAVNAHAQGRVVGKVAPPQPVEHIKGEVAIIEPVRPAADNVFSGRVVDHFGNAFVELATVTIYDAEGNELATALTNEEGQFSLPLEAERLPYSAVFRKEEYEDTTLLFADLLATREITVEMNRTMHIIMGLVAPEIKE